MRGKLPLRLFGPIHIVTWAHLCGIARKSRNDRRQVSSESGITDLMRGRIEGKSWIVDCTSCSSCTRDSGVIHLVGRCVLTPFYRNKCWLSRDRRTRAACYFTSSRFKFQFKSSFTQLRLDSYGKSWKSNSERETFVLHDHLSSTFIRWRARNIYETFAKRVAT